MSDVHCPICLTISYKKAVSNENEYIGADNSDYIAKKYVTCRWKDNIRDDYVSAFNIDNIQKVNSILTETLTKMGSTTQTIIDDLYVNFKYIFISPAISINMYKEVVDVSALNICIVLCAFVVVISMCLLYMRFVSRVSPSIFGLMFMGSVILSICSSSCVLYSAGSGVKRVHVVLSGLRKRLFV